VKFIEGMQSIKYNRDKKYVLSGSEYYLRDSFISTLKSAHPDLPFFSFDPKTETEALECICSRSLFDSKIVLVKDFDKCTYKKFVEPIKQSEDYLILTLSEKANARSKAVTAVKSMASQVTCGKLREWGSDYPIWISTKLSALGFTKENGVDELIYSKVGPDMYALSNELKKLAIYKNEDRHIRIEDVNTITSTFSRGSTYEILSLLLNRDVAGALKAIEDYMKVNSNLIGLVLFLGHYIEKMYRIVLFHEKNYSPDDIASILGIPAFILKTKYLSKALSLGQARLEKIFDAICTLDVQLRTFKGDKKILINQFVFEFKN